MPNLTGSRAYHDYTEPKRPIVWHLRSFTDLMSLIYASLPFITDNVGTVFIVCYAESPTVSALTVASGQTSPIR